MSQGLTALHPLDMPAQPAGEVLRPAQHMAQSQRRRRQIRGGQQHGLGLPFAAPVVRNCESLVTPRRVQLKRLRGQRDVILRIPSCELPMQVFIDLDRRSHQIAPHSACKQFGSDERINWAVAHLVIDQVVARAGAEQRTHRGRVTAVHAQALHSRTEGVWRAAAGSQGDAMAGREQAFDQADAEVARAADDQDGGVHGQVLVGVACSLF